MKKVKYFWKFEIILIFTILLSLCLTSLIYISYQRSTFNNYARKQVESVARRILQKYHSQAIKSETDRELEQCIEDEFKFINDLQVPLYFILFDEDEVTSTSLPYNTEDIELNVEETGGNFFRMNISNKTYLVKIFKMAPHTDHMISIGILFAEYTFYEDVKPGLVYMIVSQLLLLILGTIGILLISNSFEKTIQGLSESFQKTAIISVEDNEDNNQLIVNTSPEFSSLIDTFKQITKEYQRGHATRKAKEKLEQELQIAHQIQDAFLTKNIPEFRDCEIVAYYDFAKEIGGDYYDVLQIDDDKVAIAIADVSGKGVPGSLIMVMIRSILRAEAFGKESPLSLIKKLNYLLMKDLRPGKFVTMVYSILDLNSHALKVVNAGHLPLLVWRDKTKKIEQFNPEGIGLGLTNGKVFYNNLQEGTLKLNYNDIVIYYTDGITEAMNSEKEEYGEERFFKAIKDTPKFDIHEFKKLLLKDLWDFIGEEPLSDDLTMVVLKMK